MKSIFPQEKGECWLCARLINYPVYHQYLEEHHIFYGTANRKMSERLGMKVKLCPHHHRGDKSGNKDAIHHNKAYDLYLKRYAQTKFEEHFSRDDFIDIFGKSWL